MLRKPVTDTQITHLDRLWLYVVCALLMAFLILPSIIVIPMSFSSSRYLEFPPQEWSLRWYRSYFGSVEWMDATKVSLTAAFFTVLIATPLGTAAAYGLHVMKAKFGELLRMPLIAPMMVPHILIAIGLFFLFAKLGLNNTMIGLVLAHSMMAIPFVLITVSAGLKNYDMNQELAGRSLGASRLKAFLTITFPQIKLSVISGALFAFIVSLDEVVIALFISGGENATLTRRMFNALRDEINPTIAAISTLLIILSITMTVLVQVLGQKNEPDSH